MRCWEGLCWPDWQAEIAAVLLLSARPIAFACAMTVGAAALWKVSSALIGVGYIAGGPCSTASRS